MKIILINPPPYQAGESSRFLERNLIQTYTMPLGLGYIASVLLRAGYDVSIVDAYVKKLSFEGMEEVIRKSRPDIIGISCLSDQRSSWFRLIQLIRVIDKRIKIVLGGPHPTLMPEQVLTHFKPDVIVIGEGEETMLELVKTWEDGGDINSVKGISYLEDGNFIYTPPRERIKDLDSLPFPAYHLVDINDYGGWELLRMIFEIRGFKKLPKYASMVTSRGCVGNCGYCSSPLVWKKRWTQRSALNVVDEMEMLNREYGVEFVVISDDIFTINQKRVISICDEILRRKLNIMWGFETSVNFVSAGLLNLVKRAGCFCILYGVESGSEVVLSNVSKRIKEDDVIHAFEMTKSAGIVAGAFLMVGNPGESEESINDTIRLLRKINPDIVLPQIAMITPGTKIFDLAKEKCFIDESFWLTDKPFPYYTCERKLKTLLRWYRKLYYYCHNDFSILLHTIRDYIELHTGMRIMKEGLFKVEVPPD
jgi:radical SAM superfamily enzyme YgiQ (UPF0313 family)